MTSLIKTPQEIQVMKEGGEKLSRVLTELIPLIKVGVNLLEIEEKAVQLIKKAGGEPAFCRVPGYHWATCLNINEEIVHAIPRDYVIKNGDVVNIDIGLYYKGFNTDMSSTYYVQTQNSKLKTINYKEDKVKDTSEVARRVYPGYSRRDSSEVEGEKNKFLDTGKKALREAIKMAKPGNYIGQISQTIERVIERAGYAAAKKLTGHGIGIKLHEPPVIPCFLNGPIENTMPIKEGMTLALEVIYCLGKPDLEIDQKNKWTIRTKDGKISAVFEATICITKKGAQVLTKLPFLSCLKDD